MVKTDILRTIIKNKGMTQKKVAEMLGISEKTFYHKMSKKIFNSNEMNALVKLLELENPGDVFFDGK